MENYGDSVSGLCGSCYTDYVLNFKAVFSFSRLKFTVVVPFLICLEGRKIFPCGIQLKKEEGNNVFDRQFGKWFLPDASMIIFVLSFLYFIMLLHHCLNENPNLWLSCSVDHKLCLFSSEEKICWGRVIFLDIKLV